MREQVDVIKFHLDRFFAYYGIFYLVRTQKFPLILPTILRTYLLNAQSAFTCSKLTIETLEQGMKYVQS